MKRSELLDTAQQIMIARGQATYRSDDVVCVVPRSSSEPHVLERLEAGFQEYYDIVQKRWITADELVWGVGR
jgi:hypothetical protein